MILIVRLFKTYKPEKDKFIMYRTYLRILFDEMFKFGNVVRSFVNFYYKTNKKSPETLKFFSEKPIIKDREKQKVFFQSITGDKIDCK